MGELETRVGGCVCLPAQCGVWSCELLGTLLWVQLDLQDVFVREAISSFNVQTHTHTHRCLQALVLMAQGYWSMPHASLRNMFGMQRAGKSQSSEKAFPVASV